jgi:transposase
LSAGSGFSSLSSEIEVLARQDKGCERLMTMPGIGPIIASAIYSGHFNSLRPAPNLFPPCVILIFFQVDR